MNWEKYDPYFKTQEFVCKCCGKEEMKKELLELLYKARVESGIPFIINSGYRCEKHNKKVGGASNSAHLRGYAVDISCTNSNRRYDLLKVFMKYFKRVGLHKQFIHVDCDPSLPQDQVFFY